MLSSFEQFLKRTVLIRFWLSQSIAFILLPLGVYFLIFFALQHSFIEFIKLPEWMFIAVAFFADTARIQSSFYKDSRSSESKLHQMIAITTIGLVVSTVFLVISTIAEYNSEFKLLLNTTYFLIQLYWFAAAVAYSAYTSIWIGRQTGIDRLFLQSERNINENHQLPPPGSDTQINVVQKEMTYQNIARWIAKQHEEQAGLIITAISGDNYPHPHTRDYRALTSHEALHTTKTDSDSIEIIDSSGLIVGRLINIAPVSYEEFARAFEICYGHHPVMLELIKVKKGERGIDGKRIGELKIKVKSEPRI